MNDLYDFILIISILNFFSFAAAIKIMSHVFRLKKTQWKPAWLTSAILNIIGIIVAMIIFPFLTKDKIIQLWQIFFNTFIYILFTPLLYYFIKHYYLISGRRTVGFIISSIVANLLLLIILSFLLI